MPNRPTPKRPENWIIIASLAAFFLIVGGVAGIPLFAKRLNGANGQEPPGDGTPSEPTPEVQRQTYQQLCAKCAARRYWSTDGTDKPALEPTMLWIKTGGPKKNCSHEWFNVSGVGRKGGQHSKLHVQMDRKTVYVLSDTTPGVDALLARAGDIPQKALSTWGKMLRYCATVDDSYTPPFNDNDPNTAPSTRQEIIDWLDQNMSSVEQRLGGTSGSE